MGKTLEYISDRRSPVGDVGIELEVEGRMLTNSAGSRTGYFSQFPHVRNWVAKGDGSLRNGVEYITRSPVKVDDKLEGRLSSLVDAIKENVTDDSDRTSCHVHVNCLRLTPRELATGLTSYWLAEEILADYWGEERKGNHYCARLKDGISVTAINGLLSSKSYFHLGGNNDSSMSRYAACNMTAFMKHGSVEFRGMRGTVDTKVILDWVRTVYHIMHVASKRYKSPVHLFENYMNTSNVVDFMKKITGPHISSQLDFSQKKLDVVNDNAIRLAGLAYLHEDGDAWEEWENNLIAERSKRTKEKEEAAANSTATSPPTQQQVTDALNNYYANPSQEILNIYQGLRAAWEQSTTAVVSNSTQYYSYVDEV